jgi:lipoprotein signal peptidase
LVLVASKQDHGPGQHDYPAWQKKWNPLLSRVPGVSVRDAWEWPTFNVADCGITVGVILLVLDGFREPKSSDAKEPVAGKKEAAG